MQKNNIAIIWGSGGQDGSYLAEHLLDKGYTVVGVVRRSSLNNKERIDHIENEKFWITEGDITDFSSVSGIIQDWKPTHIYNLAAQSHVMTSFNQPIYTFEVNTIGVINILESIRKFSPETKLLHASTSEMFGSSYDIKEGKKIQDENTMFNPVSPYAVSKVAAHHMVDIYRNAYKLFVCSFIGLNHESPRRAEGFVTRKITKWIGDNIEKIRAGEKPVLHLGNLEAYRDWSHAKDFVKAMVMILEKDEPKNYLLCSNETHTVREFLELAFQTAGIENWENYVAVNDEFKRPLEVDYLCGNSNIAREELGWKPEYSFKDLVKEMVESDIKNAKHNSS